jgi:hypothetical protein
VPEPGSIIMLFTGILVILSRNYVTILNWR